MHMNDQGCRNYAEYVRRRQHTDGVKRKAGPNRDPVIVAVGEVTLEPFSDDTRDDSDLFAKQPFEEFSVLAPVCPLRRRWE